MEAQVKTKEEFKLKMATLQQKHLLNKRTKNPQFRVRPNLSTRSDELLKRIKSRTIKLDNSNDQYTLDENILAMHKMNKKDIINAHREEGKKINSLKTKLENAENKSRQAGSSTGSDQERGKG